MINIYKGRCSAMDKHKFYSLLKQEEGPKLDFKEKIEITTESGKKELSKDVIAIANSQGGRGYLLIGIQDKTKKILGIESKEYSEETIQQIISLRCDPPLTIRVEYIDIKEKIICIITIFRSFQKPHQMRQTGAFYIRRGSTTDFARRDEIASMLQYNGIINNELIPLFNMSLDVYDKELILKYLKRINLEDQIENYPLLNNLGVIHYDKDSDTFVPTLGGILIFSKNPQLYFPYASVRLINRLKSVNETLQFKGNIFSMLEDIVKYLDTLEFEYPMDILEEAIINAIIHRDYFDNSRDILINIGSSRVVVSNPGSVFGKDNINQLIRENNPRRRNGWLYNVVLIMDDKKRFSKVGTGLIYIKSKLGKDTVKYINIRKKNLFKVILPGVDYFNKK